jgi:hypothetical protein
MQGRTEGEVRLDAGHPGTSHVPAKHQVARAGEDERGVGAGGCRRWNSTEGRLMIPGKG